MATRNKQRPKVTTYDFTFPGTVAFYEGMPDGYLQEIYFKKSKARQELQAEIIKYPYADKETRDWMVKKLDQLGREMLTIQQILNSRR